MVLVSVSVHLAPVSDVPEFLHTQLHTWTYKREANVQRNEMICTGSRMVEMKTEYKSFETMPVPEPQGHCSFVAYFPLTLAAFAADWLCTADPKLAEVCGSPLTDFQRALGQSHSVLFFSTPERIVLPFNAPFTCPSCV